MNILELKTSNTKLIQSIDSYLTELMENINSMMEQLKPIEEKLAKYTFSYSINEPKDFPPRMVHLSKCLEREIKKKHKSLEDLRILGKETRDLKAIINQQILSPLDSLQEDPALQDLEDLSNNILQTFTSNQAQTAKNIAEIKQSMVKLKLCIDNFDEQYQYAVDVQYSFLLSKPPADRGDALVSQNSMFCSDPSLEELVDFPWNKPHFASGSSGTFGLFSDRDQKQQWYQDQLDKYVVRQGKR